ncbi:MAG: Lrp/AsnC ligand binding domain-containing protein [Promethearchaeota archaeon]
MSVRIWSFLTTEIGKTLEIVNKLRCIPQVKEINYITGEFDLALVIEAETGEELHTIFSERINKIPGIKRSSSNLLLKRWKEENFQ